MKARRGGKLGLPADYTLSGSEACGVCESPDGVERVDGPAACREVWTASAGGGELGRLLQALDTMRAVLPGEAGGFAVAIDAARSSFERLGRGDALSASEWWASLRQQVT